MRKFFLPVLLIVISICISSAENETVKDNGEPVKVDELVKEIRLGSIEKKPYTLKKLLDKKKAVVLIFLATECPVVDDYVDRIIKLIKDFKDKEIQFVGIHSNKHETVEDIKGYSEKHGFDNVNLPILLDPENKIADYFQARRTPEVFLIDNKKTLRYRGGIDDSRRNPEEHYLQNVLNLVLEDKPIPEKERKTRAIGCTIKRVRKAELDRTP